jgi:hypothetical protein
MTGLLSVVADVQDEINMSDQCLANILALLDEDIARLDEGIARINERKQQITDEFNARRRALENLIGGANA